MEKSVYLPPQAADGENKLSHNIAYALPMFSHFLLIAPLLVLPGIYVKYFGLSLAAIATVNVLSRFFDAVTDPLMGYFSDRYQERKGTCKPLVVIGAVLMLISGTMLYIPYGWDAQNPEPVSFAYLLFFYLAFTVAWTVMSIPQLAWGAGISSDKKGRSQRFSYRAIAVKASMLLFFLIPLLPFFETTEITPETFEFCVYLSWVVMPICVGLCVFWVPDAKTTTRQEDKTEQPASKKQHLRQVARLILGNRPLLICYAAYALVGFGYSMSNGLTYFFVDNYLGIPDKLPYAFIMNYGIAIPSAWAWGLVVQKKGPRLAWAAGMALCALGLLGGGLLPPGEASLWPYLICKGLIGIGYAATFVTAYVVMAEMADYGKWKFNQDCSATYFSLCKTIFKFNASIGVAIGLLLAGWLGFDPLATDLSEAGSIALRFAYIVLPLIFMILSIIVITRIPLNTRQHKAIRKRLATRALRTSHQAF